MQKKKSSRHVLTIIATVFLIAGAVYSFWPQPNLVDVDTVKLGQIAHTIKEEAKTQVHDTYTVNAPIDGYLLRLDTEPGDNVKANSTIVAKLLPNLPTVLNRKQKHQVNAQIATANANIAAAKSSLERAQQQLQLAKNSFERAKAQFQSKLISVSEYEQFETEWRVSLTRKAHATSQLELANAQLKLAESGLIGSNALEKDPNQPLSLFAPIDGVVLNVLQKSESPIRAGSPIVEIGDIEHELEVVAEMLSSDAVKINIGDKVKIMNWGGEHSLGGTVSRIEPFGYTKFSALGVEEQRVNVIINFDNLERIAGKLGHGYRVDVEVVVKQFEDALIIPSGSLFRVEREWAVYAVEDGRAVLKKVVVGINNGLRANVTSGLKVGDTVVVYPSSDLTNRMKIQVRP